ncbi:MAG TPA: ABC transporter ATP-binding protein [Candidatus Thermoplasmatota archaeon]|nr:ABC transporter ATP-binding protein [Candidatus Thermoplasmatota archaeon]
MPAAISVRKLTRTFGRFTAVDAIDLEVEEGELYGFLGVNGAGKSTTIRMLCGLLPPTSGSASVAGHDVATRTLDVRRSVGLIADLEAAQAHPSWSGREYLRYFARLWELADADARVEALLDQVALAPEWRRRPMRAYSTGMRRRVEVARAMLGSPRVLFLDEPTRGLDLPAKRDVWEWLRAVAREERMTVFLSSHEVREIRALCERLAVIASGRIVYRGATSALGATEDDLQDALVKLLRGEAGSAQGF